MPSTARTTSPRSAPRGAHAPDTPPSTTTSSTTTSSKTTPGKTTPGKTTPSKTTRRTAARPADPAPLATPATVDIDSTDADTGTTDTTPAVSGGATASGVSTRAAGGGAASRLPAGALRGLIEDFLRDHPAEKFGPVAIAQQLGGKSSGAVSNALDKLVDAGIAAQVKDRPRRYALAASAIPGDAMPAARIGDTPDSAAGAHHEDGRSADAPAEAGNVEAAAVTTGRGTGRAPATGGAGGHGRARGTGRATRSTTSTNANQPPEPGSSKPGGKSPNAGSQGLGDAS